MQPKPPRDTTLQPLWGDYLKKWKKVLATVGKRDPQSPPRGPRDGVGCGESWARDRRLPRRLRSRAHTQGEREWRLTQAPAHPCVQQHFSKRPKGGCNPRIDQLMSNMVYLCNGNHSAIKKDALTYHSMNEIIQTQKAKCHRIPLTWGPWRAQIQRQETGWWEPRAGAGQWGSMAKWSVFVSRWWWWFHKLNVCNATKLYT